MWPVCFFLAIFPCHSPPSYAREDHTINPTHESVSGAPLAPLLCEDYPARIAFHTTELIVVVPMP